MTASKFEDLGISRDVLKGIRSAGWSEPTPIQLAAVPIGLEGSDLLAQAQTGTGKTGTYGSIILTRLKAGAKIPSALVLVPTRELAVQVTEELGRLSETSGHVSLAVYGGVSIEAQVKALKRGVDIVIACPGRLKDLIERKSVDLSGIRAVILDEADRMLDMGFTPIVNYILDRAPADRQTMLFSATMPPEVKKLATKYMKDYREALVSRDEPTLDLTTQYYIMTNRDSKREELDAIIADGHPKMIVFCRTRRKVDFLTRKLKRDNYNAEGIHGDVPQNRRERIIKAFRDDKLDILVASDLASRGLDIDGVDVVVNYDIPPEPETYIHRIGRTGRAGQSGRAITFVNEEDVPALNDIEKKVGRRIRELDHTSALFDNPPVHNIKERGKKKRDSDSRDSEQEKPARRAKNTEEKSADAPRKTGERTLAGSLDKPGKKRRPEADEPRKKSRKDDSEDRGKRSRRGDDEEQPRKKRRDDDSEEPRRKSRRDAEDDQPRKKRRDDDSEEPRRKSRKDESEARGRKDQKKVVKKKDGVADSVYVREPGWQEARNERRQDQASKAIGYTPQGVPEVPKALHAYVQIDRAPLPEKETTWDRLELSVGTRDGADVDKVTRFVIRASGIATKDIRNVHVFEDKSRIQVIRYRSQEVVDEVFGQTFNNQRRVMVTNLSDKKD